MLNPSWRTRVLLTGAVLAALPSAGLAQIRIATYNIDADVSTTTANGGWDTVLEGIGSQTTNGFARPLDIIGLEETTSNTVTVAPMVSTLNSFYADNVASYAMSTFQATEVGNNPNTGNGPNAIIYNTNTLQLITSVGFGTLSGSAMSRQEVRYQFRPVGYDSTADFYVYVGHYKAFGDAATMTRRALEASTVRANAASLPAGSRIIYTGDFNLTGGSAEPAWTNLTAPGVGTDPGQGVDPLGMATFNTSNSAFVSSYSEATDSLSARFDFQLNTPATTDGHGFSYINNSYHVYANNGTTPLNKAVTYNVGAGSRNTALDTLPPATGGALTTSSDHYPVIADYRLPAKMSVSVGTASIVPQVIVGATVPVTVAVSNVAPVQIAIGADGLNYTVSPGGSLTGSGSGSGLAALAGAQTSTLTFNTSAPGIVNGSISVNSTSQEVANGSFSQTGLTMTVLSHAHPSLSSSSSVASLTIDFGVRAFNSAGTPIAPFSVSNLADASGFTASLHMDSIIGAGATTKLFSNLATFTNKAGGSTQAFTAGLDTGTFGNFAATYTMNLSDQNLPGAQSTAPLTLNLVGEVALAGDANLDGTVNALDFNALAANYGQTGTDWSDADFDRSGRVDAADFALLADDFGMNYTPPSAPPLGAVVPEPTISAALLGGLWLSFRRRKQSRSIDA